MPKNTVYLRYEQSTTFSSPFGLERWAANLLVPKTNPNRDENDFKRNVRRVRDKMGIILSSELASSIKGENQSKLGTRKSGPLRGFYEIKLGGGPSQRTDATIKIYNPSYANVFRQVLGIPYPCGIKRQKTYDGKRYQKIKPITQIVRKIKVETGVIQPTQWTMIGKRLLETGKHILDGLKHKHRGGSRELVCDVYYDDPKSYELAMLHNFGGEVTYWKDADDVRTVGKALHYIKRGKYAKTSSYSKKGEKEKGEEVHKTTIPATPFIGFQSKFFTVVKDHLMKLVS